MSELNAFTFGLGQYTEDGSPCVVAFDGEKNPRLASDEKFYLKSEADKVIAKLQSKITLASLAEDCSNLRNKRCNYCSELQRQKYKRCLSMADGCQDKIKYWHIRYTSAAGYDRSYEKWKHRLLTKWLKRWLAIAEKFNPNSTAQ